MIGYPLDSHVEYDTDGTPIYDRAISSAPMRKLYKKLFSDGVLPNPSTNMQVSAGTGMNVIVSPGFAMCNGCMKLEEAQRTLAVQASSAAHDRIDTVVLRLNDNDSERICDFYILQGTPAVSPVRPELTRTESIWELGLADLFIAKNSTAVSNQRITDTRYETARCGIMSSISEFDTTTLYQQVQDDLAGFKAEEQADFIEWFEYIKGQLSEDVAGNLQNQIGSLPSLVTEIKDSLVNAINWVAKKLSVLATKIGSTDISGIGDGTVTGAISSQNEALKNKVNTNDSRLSDARMPTAHTHDDRYYTESEVNTLVGQRLAKSGDNMTGSLNFAGSAWNSVGDDCYFGDNNVGGCIALKGISGLTGLAFYGRSGSNYDRIMVADDGYDMYIAVNGALYVSNGAADARAPIYASAFNQSSSRRVKEHIVNVSEEDAEKLMELRPVHYDYIGDDAPKDCAGLIAEEVAQILPDCVNGDVNCADDDLDAIRGIGIDYSKFVPYIIKMLQIHDAEIKRLQKDE